VRRVVSGVGPAQRRVVRSRLAAVPLFAGLPATQLAELAAAARLLELGPRMQVNASGAPFDEVFVLCSGTVLRFRELDGAARKVVELVHIPQLLGCGEFFGAARHESGCETVSACELLVLEARVLRDLAGRSLALSGRILQAVAERLCEVEFDVAGRHASRTSAQRILDYLIELAGVSLALAGETTVELAATKKVLAARIGITPEAFSRSLRELVDKGVIVVDKRLIHIQHAALLDTGAGEQPQRLSFARRNKGARRDEAMSVGELVNLCGGLRLLVQRQAIEWALIAHGVAPVEMQARLRQSIAEFERSLAVLHDASLAPELGEALDDVGRVWADYRSALSATERAPVRAAKVLQRSEDFITAADFLNAVAGGFNASGSLYMVNIAGRNRMLSQRVAKFFLFEGFEGCPDRAQAQIAASCRAFEHNQRLLRENAGELPELVAQIEATSALWARFIASLDPEIRQPHRIGRVRAVLDEGERLLRYTNTVVKLFERLAR
jgi:CRP-like cAMP-binding protein